MNFYNLCFAVGFLATLSACSSDNSTGDESSNNPAAGGGGTGGDGTGGAAAGSCDPATSETDRVCIKGKRYYLNGINVAWDQWGADLTQLQYRKL